MRNDAPPARRSAASLGSTQRGRALPALDPASVPVDERGVTHRLAFAGKYARLLSFYALNGEPAGDWAAFFRRDASFLMAEMCTAYSNVEFFDAVALERRLRESGEDSALEREVMEHIHRLAARIDDWHRRAGETLQALRGDGTLQSMLATVIREDLSKYWSAVTDNDAWRRYWNDCERDARAAEAPAALRTRRFDAQVWEEGVGGMPPEPPAQRLITILNAFHRATKKLSEQAAAPLVASFDESDHPPHTALWIVFAMLMEAARDDLNRFSERHLDYYYRGVLRLRERDGSADSTPVYFELAPPNRELLLKAGARLAAGKDASGQDVMFATDADVALDAAHVAAVMTLRVAQSGPPDASAGRWVERIVARPKADSADGQGKPLPQPDAGWPSFGGPLPSAPAGPAAEVGVAVASPLLLLGGGQREVIVTFQCASAPPGGKPFAQVAREYLDAVERAAGDRDAARAPDAPRELPADTCLLYVSAASGWVLVPSFRLRHDDDTATLELDFRLPAAAPPIAPAASAALVGGIASPWPLLKLVLNARAQVYAYSFFQQLVLEGLQVKVKAAGVRDVSIHSATGPIKSGQPFPVFGVVPVQGAAVEISHPELGAKRLEYVALSIDWANVPKNLTSYYQAYGRQIDERTFQGRLFLRSAGSVLEEQFALFAEGARASATLDMRRDARAIEAAAGAADARFAALCETVPVGTLRLELAEPEFAFGHDLYPQVVTEAALARTSAVLREVMQQGRGGGAGAGKTEETLPEKVTDFVKVSLDLADWALPRGRQEAGEGGAGGPSTGEQPGAGEAAKPAGASAAPFPNPPFAPFAKGVSIDYVASGSLQLDTASGAPPDGDRIELYGLHPFGHQRWRSGVHGMFPAFDAEGYLHIGLAELGPAGAVSLLFHLRETAAFHRLVASQVDIEQALGSVRWRYLAADGWRDLPAESIVDDATRGLTRSGIVQLRIPADAVAGDTLLPGKLTWVQASVAAAVDSYPNIVGIHAQAVTASRVTPMPADVAGASLAPGRIAALVEKVAAVKAVHQPMASVGGRPRDAADQFRARVSERLRHKQRAIQPFDYERLVLDAFPQIGQACCLTCNTTRDYGKAAVEPGKVVVAVVAADRERAHGVEAQVPYASLSTIRDYLKGLASPAVRDVVVVNPVYETVSVSARVRFVSERDAAVGLLRLKDDLADYIAPWREHADTPVRLGSGLGPMRSLRHYLEELEYVAQLRVDAVEVTGEDGTTTRFVEAEEVRGSVPWAVLVPAAEQNLTLLADEDEAAHGAPPAPAGAAPEEEVRQYFLVIPVERLGAPDEGG